MKFIQIIVKKEPSDTRVDKYLSSELNNMTRSSIQRLIKAENVKVNGITVDKSYILRLGDIIDICLPKSVSYDVIAQDIPLDIFYEDDDLLVVNKPQNMVVHPAAGNRDGTLVNALLYHCEDNLSGINGVIRPGIVHRIDKDTSGLLIVAKSDIAHIDLARQIKEHSFKRVYHTIVSGNIKEDSGTISAPIGRHSINRKKMTVTDKNSKAATTHFKVLERFGRYTYLECRLQTGRTHQIRVHLSSLDHPVVGDNLYGSSKNEFSLKGQCLHAKMIGFTHPITMQYLEFDSELPTHFKMVLTKLRERYKIE